MKFSSIVNKKIGLNGAYQSMLRRLIQNGVGNICYTPPPRNDGAGALPCPGEMMTLKKLCFPTRFDFKFSPPCLRCFPAESFIPHKDITMIPSKLETCVARLVIKILTTERIQQTTLKFIHTTYRMHLSVLLLQNCVYLHQFTLKF